MPGLVAPAPPTKRVVSRRGMADRRHVARDGLTANTKMKAAKISIQDPQLVLKKRLHVEMEALHGLLKKAELLSGKKTTVAKSGAPPRCSKDGRFMAAEDKSEATEAERTTCAKRRKVMPVAEPKMLAEEKRQDQTDPASVSGSTAPSLLDEEDDGEISETATGLYRGQPKAPLIAPDQGAFRGLIAKACQKKRRICNPERQSAYEELEQMEVDAARISDWIEPVDLARLGITPVVEYAVTSEWSVPCRSGCPVQRLLGLFLKKAE